MAHEDRVAVCAELSALAREIGHPSITLGLRNSLVKVEFWLELAGLRRSIHGLWMGVMDLSAEMELD